MRHIVAVVALALAGVPAGALAAKPSHPATPTSTNANSNANTTTTTTASTNGKSAKVTFVLRGKVTSYAAGSLLGITLKSSNHQRATLTSGMALTLTLDAKTKVVLHNRAAVAPGDMAVVKIRAPKNATSSALSSTAAAQVVDQGGSTT